MTDHGWLHTHAHTNAKSSLPHTGLASSHKSGLSRLLYAFFALAPTARTPLCTVTRFVGQGAFGEVYEVTWTGVGTDWGVTMAMKTIRLADVTSDARDEYRVLLVEEILTVRIYCSKHGKLKLCLRLPVCILLVTSTGCRIAELPTRGPSLWHNLSL